MKLNGDLLATQGNSGSNITQAQYWTKTICATMKRKRRQHRRQIQSVPKEKSALLLFEWALARVRNGTGCREWSGCQSGKANCVRGCEVREKVALWQLVGVRDASNGIEKRVSARERWRGSQRRHVVARSAHGWAMSLVGQPTARARGRLTRPEGLVPVACREQAAWHSGT